MRWTLCLALAAALACGRPTSAPPPAPTLEETATRYRERRDLANLEAVVAVLEPGTPRVEIERLLGEADGWDDPTVFYRSDRANLAGERLGLTLDFYLWFTDGRAAAPSDRLERWVLGSGNRFESADAQIPKRGDPLPDPLWASLEPTAALYRQQRDYASLRALVRRLRLGTPRRDVIALLGKPDRCGVEGLPCHYATEKRNAAGLPIGITVDYRVHNVGGDKTVVTDRLEMLGFGPVPRD
jgi:hypothetical protein